MPPDQHHVLWTAGWDSTYRVADLLLVHGRRVQPVYVRDPERRSTARELLAIARISQALRAKDPSVASRLLPLQIIELADIPPDARVTAAAQAIGARTPMGAQYEWLGWLAASTPDVPYELGWEGPLRFGPIAAARFVTHEAPEPDNWMTLPREGNDEDQWVLFGRYRCPILALTKLDMRDRARERGFADVLEMTWFCRWPTILGRPCGFCDPCRSTRSLGLEYRVPAPTRSRAFMHRARWGLVRRGAVLRANAGSVGRRLRGTHD
jgi:hypothetical protein